MDIKIYPGEISGELKAPPSKSHTIRALIIASLANGESSIVDPLYSDDTASCIDFCRAMGAEVAVDSSSIRVKGCSGRPSFRDGVTVDVGNSGTTLYFALSLAALGDRSVTFVGDEQISRRSAEPLLNGLKSLGATLSSSSGCTPITVKGPLSSGRLSLVSPTSQYLSSLLLAAPLIGEGETSLTVPLLNERPYVEMTLQWLKERGVEVKKRELKEFTIPGGQEYTPFSREIPGDYSSASFFIAAGAVQQRQMKIAGLNSYDSQGDKSVVDMVEAMGACCRYNDDQLTVSGGSLYGRAFDLNATPDALPIMSVVGSLAKGKTELLNVPQARIKECDRIAVMVQELRKMGALVEELPDGLTLNEAPLKGGEVEGHGDHRVIMSLAVAALKAEKPTTIRGADSVDISFPQFYDIFKECGASFEWL